jgi:NAD(P)-dependent dehydrogenase (short-subunit alcohol dehydrogenase family)
MKSRRAHLRNPGFDAYATSRQCVLAATMALARENLRLRINALEPGFTPNTGLARDANATLRLVANYLQVLHRR